MDLLNNDGQEASVRPAAARELKLSGEDCDAGSLGVLPKAAFPWPVSVSEGSVSSMDSLAAGESYSPSDFSTSMFSKGRPGLNMPESLALSDDDVAPDRVEGALGGANSRRRVEDLTPAGGDSVEASLFTHEYFAKMRDDGAGFHYGSTLSFPTSEGSSDATEQLLELDLGFKRKAPGKGVKLVDEHSDAESVSNAVCSVGLGSVAPDHTLAASEDLPCSRVKFMCSYGGKILPRPSVGDLRYVGGETHLVTVPRDISYADLMSKVSELSGLSPTFKYQLPDQELDTLVSVSSDEDLENMMEEYDKIEAGEGSSRLRVFLFTAADYEMTSLGEQLGYFKDPEQRYVDAVNGLLEPGCRKQSDGPGGSGAPPVENLLDVDGPWVKDAVREAVPVALLAPQVPQDVASLLHHVPVPLPVALPVASLPTSSYQSNPPAISAPLSAPSSPPSAALTGLMAPPAVSDLLFQEAAGKSGHLYTGLVPSDSSYKDQDGYVSSAVSSSTSVHDAHFRGVETRRAPESPPKPQMMPRAGSHGQLLDYERCGRLEHMEGFPLPDLQRLVLHQQQQPWQHAVDLQAESYRRADLLAHDAVPPGLQQTPAFGPSTQPAMHFRPAPPGHDALYWQMEQAQLQPQTQQQLPSQHGEDIYGLHHMQRSISAHALLHSGPGAGTGAPYQGPSGSAPTSPRLSYRDVPGRLMGGQQQLLHRQYAHPDGKYGRRVHAYADPPSRPLPASPPRHRDREYVPPVDEHVMRQQQLPPVGVAAAPILSTEAVPHDPLTGAVLHQYEPSTVSQSLYSEVLPRSSVPQYVVLNPYQDGLLSYQDHQDSGEVRRHMLTPGMEHSGVMASQSHYKVPIGNHKQFVPPPEQHSRLPDVDWRGHDTEDRLRVGGRVWVGQPNYLENNLGTDLGASQSAPSSFSGFHFPEDSDAVLSQEPYVPPPVWNARVEESVSSAQGRSGALPTLALPGFISFRGAPVDGAHSHNPYYAKPVDNEHKVTAAMAKSLLGLQDMSANSAQASSSHGVLPAKPLLDEHVTPFTQLAPALVNAEVAAGPTVVATVSEPWQGGSPAEELPRGGHMPLLLDEHDRKVANLFGNEVAGKLVSTISPAGLEDWTRAAELSSVFTQANGSLLDDRLTSNYALDGLSLIDETVASIPTAAPVGYSNVSPLISVQPSVTSVGGDRPTHAPRSQSVYKPSPLGVQSIGLDPYSGVDKFNLVPDGQTNQSVTGEGLTKNDSHRSGAAHLAEDVAASVLASREPPLFDKSSPLRDNLEVATTVGDPTPAATGSCLTPASNTDKAPFEGKEVHPVEGPSDAGVAAASESGRSAQLKPREGLEELKIPDVVEEMDHGSSPPEEDTAAKAKREAIARGLQTIHNEDLEELRELGSGTFGTVYHGKWRGSDVAIKRIKASCFAGRPSEQERLRADFWREACTLSQLHHPNVVAFYGVVPDGPGGTLATVTEYMVNGSMKQVMQKKDRTIDRRKRLLIAMDAAFGMEYLHSKNIVHFDLKCENLLVNMRDPQRPICKVGDLGLSKVKHQTMVSGGVRGTLPWMAPELLNGRTSMVTDKVDVYSFGIVMWELLTGEEPYASMHYGAIIGGIVNDSLRPDIPHWCEPAWRNLMERCWAADPAARPSFSDIASELRTMSAAPKAQGQSQPHTHVQGQNSPPRAHGGSPPRVQGQVSPPQRQGKMSPPRAL